MSESEKNTDGIHEWKEINKRRKQGDYRYSAKKKGRPVIRNIYQNNRCTVWGLPFFSFIGVKKVTMPHVWGWTC